MALVMELTGKALWTQAKGHSMYAGEYHADKKKSLSGQSSIERESGKSVGSLEGFEVRFKPWATHSKVIADPAPSVGLLVEFSQSL